MTKWNYQARLFSESDPRNDLRPQLDKSGELKGRDQKVTDTYVVGASDVAVRVRDGQIKVKGVKRSVDAVVDEVRDDRFYFPVDSVVVTDAIGVINDGAPKKFGSLQELISYAARKSGVVVRDVPKESKKYEGAKLEVELTTLDIGGKPLYTVCVASDNVQAIHQALQQFKLLQMQGAMKMEYAQAIRKYNG